MAVPAQQLSVPWTHSLPRSPLSSPPAHSHPPRSTGRHTLHFLELDLTATRTASRALNSHLTPQGVLPLLVMTGAHEAQSVTWREAPLRAPHLFLLTSHLGLPRSTPPPTCWALMTAARWAAGRLGQTEAPLLCLSIIQCPTHSLEILAVSGNLVSGCNYPAVKQLNGSYGPTKPKRNT